jgi:hypothetical protein
VPENNHAETTVFPDPCGRSHWEKPPGFDNFVVTFDHTVEIRGEASLSPIFNLFFS